MTKAYVYADHNAQCPVRSVARLAAAKAIDHLGNPSSVHAGGRVAKAMLDDARDRVAAAVGARASEVVFTSGATEANNQAVFGSLRGLSAAAICLSHLEHDSIVAAARSSGVRNVFLNVTQDGSVDTDHLSDVLNSWDREQFGPPLVALMLANNETGIIQPVQRAAELVHRAGGYVICDAVQALGRIPIDIDSLGVDYLTLSAHKIGGLSGVGALIVRGNSPLGSYVHGGGQESGRRAGTENMAGVAAFAAAIDEVTKSFDEAASVALVRDAFEASLATELGVMQIVGAAASRLGNTSCVYLPGIASEMVVMAMDLDGVACSAGSACSSGKVQPSRVLQAMGFDENSARFAVRFSFGWSNTEQEAHSTAQKLNALVGRNRNKKVA